MRHELRFMLLSNRNLKLRIRIKIKKGVSRKSDQRVGNN